jgi:tRNA-modifying protein YgfZ
LPRFDRGAGSSIACCAAATNIKPAWRARARAGAASFPPIELNRTFFDLSQRAKLRVSGGDRERFLNGQLTNDVRKATETRAIEACVLNPKGKLNAHLFVRIEGETFVLDGAAEQRELLLARFERYIIADDVQVETVGDELCLFHIIDTSAPVLANEVKIVSTTRFREPGYDVWAAARRHDDLFRDLSDRFTFCDADCAEVFRIEQGVPRWGRELTEEIIPIEAGLETRTIDYEKGCYIGQEVISRIKMSGQVNKRLCGLISLQGMMLVPGMKLFSAEGEKKDAGWITSVAHSGRLGKEIALGYVKRGFNLPGVKLEGRHPESISGSAIAAVEIVNLPFAVDD